VQLAERSITAEQLVSELDGVLVALAPARRCCVWTMGRSQVIKHCNSFGPGEIGLFNIPPGAPWLQRPHRIIQ
jgi:hypothetical protein